MGYSDNLGAVLGIPQYICKGFMRLLSLEIVHSIAEQALECEFGKLKEFEIVVPNICKMKIGEGMKVISVRLDPTFSRQLSEAVKTGTSPLVIESEQRLINNIKKRYPKE